MFRIDDPTAATSLPTPEAAGTEGYFTEGNPTAGTPATNVRGSWLNMIQEELRAIVVAAGLTPSKTAYNQVLLALTGRYLGSQVFTSSGTYTPGVYNGVTAKKGRFRGVAAGGGSGGCIATSSGQVAGSGAGSAGNPFDFWVISGLASMAITVGAAGAAGPAGANNGGAGGDLIIGAIATIKGGRGGGAGNATATFPSLFNPSFANANSTIASAGGMVLAGIINGLGQTGVRGIALSTGSLLYAAGGNSAWGTGGTVDSANGGGYGSGGGGNGIGQSTAASPGFAGSGGILVIDEFA